MCACVHVFMAADDGSSITTDRWTVHRLGRLGCVDYSKDSMTLPRSFSPSSTRPLGVRRMNGRLSLSVSSHAALSSSVSPLVLSFLCKDVRLVYHSLHPSVHPSIPLSDEYLSLSLPPNPPSIYPSNPALPPTVGFVCSLCAFKCESACALARVCLFVCFSMRSWLRGRVCV